jgi:hypothetical protein
LAIKENKEHLTHEGLLQIMALKAALNKGLTKTTDEIKNIEILERPLHLFDLAEFKHIDPHWISGFVAGDGSFEIKVRLRKSGHEVGLTFSLSQHIRDAHLFGVLANYLDCGKVYTSSTGLNCYLKVQKFSDVHNKIIPFFNKYPVGTVKEKDFRDFALAAELIQNKAHLTPDGLAKIKSIKSNMNSNKINE